MTVAAVIERDGRFLMVEEETPEGLRINQPAGHLEPGESLRDAVIREAFEETGHRFFPEALIGVYRWTQPDGETTYLRFAWTGDVRAPESSVCLDEGIVRTLWMTPDELRASVARHRSRLVMQCVEDWLSGHRHPLELVREFES